MATIGGVAFRSRRRRSERTDDTPSAKHAAVEPPQGPGEELHSYLAALAPGTESDNRFGDAQVLHVRLDLPTTERLKVIAAREATSPQALVQDWVVQRIAHESGA